MTESRRGIGNGEGADSVLRLAVECADDHAFVTLNPDGTITFWNLGAERLLGWSGEQALRAHVSSVLGPGGRNAGIGADDLEDARRQGAVSATRQLNHRDGSTRPAITTIRAVRSDALVLGYAVTARPLPAAAQEATAADDHRQLAESGPPVAAEAADRTQADAARARLIRRLVLAEDDERRRLARDLHDGLGQQLTVLRLMLEGLDGGPQARGNQAAVVTDALEMLRQIDQDLDFIAWELRPAALEELGLTSVLDTYVKEWSRQVRIPAKFYPRPDTLPRFAAEVEASVYRIVQEGLNNVAKHARARSVNVLLELRRDSLTLIVEDDGVGRPSAAGAATTIGFTGMRERALAVGGTLELEPTPGGGTTVLASIPLTAEYRERPSASGGTGSSEGTDSASLNPEAMESAVPGLTAIRARVQELQRAVGARDEFIATVAHELRNPIAPLTFQVRLALNKTEELAAAGTPVSADWVRGQLRGVEQRLHRVLETLDRLLDVSRLSTGRIDLQAERMNLGGVVREVVEGFDAELAAARCALTLSERGDATGVWDRLRVEQICRNLVSNAIRFGAGRPIEVDVDADRDFASIVVRDHGIGVAPEQQSRIFERFERGVEQRSGGFGVGLWIVRTICAAMGGTVSVDSVMGEGASFTVMLPRRPARDSAEPALG